ncbi:MAG: hypothetical protein KIT36_09180 [Alphaproteobacteria bacterium]|nr:hypothetical protein [Alphaproteobacteria bacterium]
MAEPDVPSIPVKEFRWLAQTMPPLMARSPRLYRLANLNLQSPASVWLAIRRYACPVLLILLVQFSAMVYPAIAQNRGATANLAL